MRQAHLHSRPHLSWAGAGRGCGAAPYALSLLTEQGFLAHSVSGAMLPGAPAPFGQALIPAWMVLLVCRTVDCAGQGDSRVRATVSRGAP